jgi:FAD/FMN-containing dehydrogenase
MHAAPPPGRRKRLANFGANVVSRPQVIVTPRSEQEVLSALARHRGRQIRAVGRLHSWSEAVRADDVLIDLRHLSAVAVTRDKDGPLATVGAGCQIKRLLAELAQHGLTMPTLGLISEQTIAGAAATGTHGSGRHSLSHYLCEVRIAHFDPLSGEPAIRVIRAGDELRAARCSLGCLGIVVSVGLRLRPAYRIEEWMQRHESLESVLAAESDTPLEQFYFVPWLWTCFVQHRRETDRPRSFLASLYRVYWFLTMDLGLHLMLRLLVQVLRSDALVRWFYRHIVPLTVIRGWHVIDDSADMLVMEHELFRHIEIEVFVQRGDLPAALDFLRELLEHCGGNAAALSTAMRDRLRTLGLDGELDALLGTYVHHYVICVRRVLPDDTLISMTSGDDQPRYALSLISYARPERRQSFLRFADFLARSMATLFDGRPHWGKVCPLDAAEIARLYPKLASFREICRRMDPRQRFASDWTARVLGLDSRA